MRSIPNAMYRCFAPSALVCLTLTGLPATSLRLLDDFEDGRRPQWQNLILDRAQVYEDRGWLSFEVPPNNRLTGCLTVRPTEKLEFTDGSALELRVDLVDCLDPDAFVVLGWMPDSRPLEFAQGWLLQKSAGELRISKAIGADFVRVPIDPTVRQANVTLALQLSKSGATVSAQVQVLDKEAGDAVLFERVVTDSPAADPLMAGTDEPAAPFLGGGYFLLGVLKDGPGQAMTSFVWFDRAQVSAEVGTNELPVLFNFDLPNGASFVAGTQDVTARIYDEDGFGWPADGQARPWGEGILAVASGPLGPTQPQVSISYAAFGSSTNRPFDWLWTMVDARGATSAVPYSFDTFSRTNVIVEIEDYNFGGGQFIGLSLAPPGTYAGRVGVAEVDYHDLDTDPGASAYRPGSLAATQRSWDYVRPWIVEAGGADDGLFDLDVYRVRFGEWLQFTRSFPTGVYAVYLRAAVWNLREAELALEVVTGNSSLPNAASTALGRFKAGATGFAYRNIPLSNAEGQTLALSLSGRQTIRLRQLTDSSEAGDVFENYLVFVPVSLAVTVESADSAVGPWTMESGAILDTSAWTATLARSSAGRRFYRLMANFPLRLGHVAIETGKVLLRFELAGP